MRPERVSDAVGALEVELTEAEVAFLEEPYLAHDLVGPAGRPGEKSPAGTMKGRERTPAYRGGSFLLQREQHYELRGATMTYTLSTGVDSRATHGTL